MFTKLLSTVVLAGITTLTVANAADDGLAQKSAWKGQLKAVTTGQHSGASCLETAGNNRLFSNKMYKIDAEKTYVLSGWFKSIGGNPSRLYFGFMPLDKNKKNIGSRTITVEPKTETVLAADCKPDDTVIKIKDGSKWRKHKYCVIAFNADLSGEYKDLPNTNITKAGIVNVEKEGDIWAVTLSKPCGKAFPAGTPVREHRSASSYQYSAASNKKVPAEWTKYSGTVKGISLINTPTKQFWAGTAYVRILILANYQAKDDETLLFDDIKLEEQ
jgi:hypothetical protein